MAISTATGVPADVLFFAGYLLSLTLIWAGLVLIGRSTYASLRFQRLSAIRHFSEQAEHRALLRPVAGAHRHLDRGYAAVEQWMPAITLCRLQASTILLVEKNKRSSDSCPI